MRQKELRIALVCYGGISLAVYMHGVTKELWKTLQASRAFWAGEEAPEGTARVYRRLLQRLEEGSNLRLRVLTDIVAGASAGGINSVFLSQAIHSGQSLEPLTELWLENADIDVLLDPEARARSQATKFWARPIVSYLLHRPGNAVSTSVAPETREEVREKLSRLIRSRWFEPPFSGIGLSRLLAGAFSAMERANAGPALLPHGHPINLFVTATDFKGHLETLRLHSPELVLESEHRLTIGFEALSGSANLAPMPELLLASRSTASFPGAFPPLQIEEIDNLVSELSLEWPDREAFFRRIMPEHSLRGDLDKVALIDGSVLNNAPFADAMAVLRDRPATREVDRRFVYIDPTPDRIGASIRRQKTAPGFFSTIFGSLSSIPREQPIRDNLEALERQSQEMATMRTIILALRPEIEETVDRLFGNTFFLDRPTPKRLAAWRNKAQLAARTGRFRLSRLRSGQVLGHCRDIGATGSRGGARPWPVVQPTCRPASARSFHAQRAGSDRRPQGRRFSGNDRVFPQSRSRLQGAPPAASGTPRHAGMAAGSQRDRGRAGQGARSDLRRACALSRP